MGEGLIGLKRNGTVMRGAFATMVGCLLLASCSSSGDTESGKKRHLKDTLCDTRVSTSALREMYPGPYSNTWMMPSSDGGINEVGTAKGMVSGVCDVSIVQEKWDIYTVVKVVVRVEPRGSVDDLDEHNKKLYPDYRRQRLTLGPAKGFASYSGSVLSFDCRNPHKHPSKDRTLGVSARVLLPLHPGSFGVARATLTKGAAKLAADTARYVDSKVLKCSSPRLPDGAPVQRAPSAS